MKCGKIILLDIFQRLRNWSLAWISAGSEVSPRLRLGCADRTVRAGLAEILYQHGFLLGLSGCRAASARRPEKRRPTKLRTAGHSRPTTSDLVQEVCSSGLVAYVKRLYVVALEGPTSHQTRKTPQRSKGAYHPRQEQGQRTSQYQGERR